MKDRELDARVAREVMGLPNVGEPNGERLFFKVHADAHEYPVFRYSTDIDAAWMVVTQMRLLGYADFCVWTHGASYGATFKGFVGRKWRAFDGYDDLAAAAICRAALAAMGVMGAATHPAATVQTTAAASHLPRA